MSNERVRQQNFSVARKYDEVWKILEIIDNKSEFICQSIIEKYNKQEEEIEYVPEAITKNDLKGLIKETLDEMVSNDLFIVKGNVDLINNNIDISQIIKETKTETIEEERQDIEEKENAVSNDTKEAVKNIIGSW